MLDPSGQSAESAKTVADRFIMLSLAISCDRYAMAVLKKPSLQTWKGFVNVQ